MHLVNNPHGSLLSETVQKRKWEDATTVDRVAWEFRKDLRLADVHSIEELITTLVQTVRCLSFCY